MFCRRWTRMSVISSVRRLAHLGMWIDGFHFIEGCRWPILSIGIISKFSMARTLRCFVANAREVRGSTVHSPCLAHPKKITCHTAGAQPGQFFRCESVLVL